MKKVTLTLAPVTVEVDGKNEKELLANAKIALLEQLKVQFPHITFSINDGDALTAQTVKIGMIVKTTMNGKEVHGIVTNLNAKTINVTLSGNRGIQGSATAFKQSTATFEEARSLRHDFMKESGEWSEGDSAYLQVKDQIIPVVVGKSKGAKLNVYPVNRTGTNYYQLDKSQQKMLQEARK